MQYTTAAPHNNGEWVNGKVFDASESKAQHRGRRPLCFVGPRGGMCLSFPKSLFRLYTLAIAIVFGIAFLRRRRKKGCLFCGVFFSWIIASHLVVRSSRWRPQLRSLSAPLHFPGTATIKNGAITRRRRHPPSAIHADGSNSQPPLTLLSSLSLMQSNRVTLSLWASMLECRIHPAKEGGKN